MNERQSALSSSFRPPPSFLPAMRILGIDPGSETTGWGVIETGGRRLQLVACGAIRARVCERFASRLLIISNGVEEILTKYQPEACAIEDAFYAANVKTAMKLGQVRGVILLAAERAGVEIGEYAPRLVKQTVVGYGAAEKHQVGEMVRVLLNLPAAPTPHDAADAVAIAICHAHHHSLASKIAASTSRTSAQRKTPVSPSTVRRRVVR